MNKIEIEIQYKEELMKLINFGMRRNKLGRGHCGIWERLVFSRKEIMQENAAMDLTDLLIPPYMIYSMADQVIQPLAMDNFRKKTK